MWEGRVYTWRVRVCPSVCTQNTRPGVPLRLSVHTGKNARFLDSSRGVKRCCEREATGVEG